jgi:site-specific DNA-methyltransferase (adenine-specific)
MEQQGKQPQKEKQAPAASLTLFSRHFAQNARGKVFLGDAFDFLSAIQESSGSIVFLDPPFNLGKDYGNGKRHDLRPHSDYLEWLSALLKEAARVLKPGGALYVYHLPSTATQITGILNQLLSFRHWIAVSMKNTFVRGEWLYPAHYALLYYTKGKPAYFTRPKIPPLKCRKCGTYIKDYGGYKPIIDEKGINLSDIWEDISPVRHSNRKFRAPNELPVTLFRRIITISGAPNEVYIDPFVGAGTGVLAALEAGMQFNACDISRESCNIVSARVERFITGIAEDNNGRGKC